MNTQLNVYSMHDLATILLCIKAGVIITTIAPKITPINPNIFGI